MADIHDTRGKVGGLASSMFTLERNDLEVQRRP